MKIRSATFFHEPRSGKESGKETVLSLSAMLAKNKGQPSIKRTVLFYKTLFYGVNKSRYSIFLLRSMEGTIFPFHLSIPHIVGKCSQQQGVTNTFRQPCRPSPRCLSKGTGCRNPCCRCASPCVCKKSKRPTTSYLSTCWVACRVTCWMLVGYLLGKAQGKVSCGVTV